MRDSSLASTPTCFQVAVCTTLGISQLQTKQELAGTGSVLLLLVRSGYLRSMRRDARFALKATACAKRLRPLRLRPEK
jgi:hypothetical protein